MPTKLVLNRKSEWLNRARPYKVIIDGEQVGKISSGKVEEFELSQINQTVECKVDWCYSNKYELTAADGDTVYLQVKSGMKAFWIIYVLLLGYIIVSFIAPGFINSLGNVGMVIRAIVLGIPFFYLAYYLTLGRRNYLSLEKDPTNVFA
jgi:hypothetical protein